MKKLLCLLAAAALFTGCAGTDSDVDRGGTDTGVGTTETGSEHSTSGSLTNGTSGSQTNGTNRLQGTQTPSQTPSQTPRGN